MAFPTAVNDQITDALTQTNVQVLGISPAQAISALYTSLGQALALAATNAVTQQQSANILMGAITTRAVASLLGRSQGVAK